MIRKPDFKDIYMENPLQAEGAARGRKSALQFYRKKLIPINFKPVFNPDRQ